MKRCACGQPAYHEIGTPSGTRYECCKCHVRGGGAPADWHAGCVAEAARMCSEIKEKTP